MSKKLADVDDDESVELGDSEPDEPGLASLEKKYGEQMRQIHPTKVDLPWLTLKTQIDAQINLRPEFQRRDRWDNKKRSRFIESVIMNVPIPPVFLGEEEYGKYVVLDGRQRLTAAYRFLTDELTLEGLDVWKELNGLTYSEIRRQGFGAAIERRFLPAIMLTKESSPEVKYEVFDRLNTGGVIATPMEVRNAIFPGRFNELLHKLSKEEGFRRLWGIPHSDAPGLLERNSLYREMADLELALRFFALRDGTLNGMRFKDRLSDFMTVRNAEYKKDRTLFKKDATAFRQAVAACLAVFGDDAFKIQRDPNRRASRSAPYADAVMQGLGDMTAASLTPAVVRRIRAGFKKLTQDPAFRKSIDKGTNGETAIRTRIALGREVVKAALPAAQRPSNAHQRRPSRKKDK